MREILGARLLEIRKGKVKDGYLGKRIWAKQDVASAAGISLAAYDRIERGKAACSLDTLEKLAEALKMAPASLLR